jgi:hypothetical protein
VTGVYFGFVHVYRGNSTDGRYLIKSRTTIGFEVTECHSAGGRYIKSGCTGSGWTLIGVLKGDNSTVSKIYIY